VSSGIKPGKKEREMEMEKLGEKPRR